MVGRRNLLKGFGVGAAGIAAAAAMGAAGSGEGAKPTPPPDPVDTSMPRKRAIMIIDRSGSMRVVRDATIEAVNKYLDDQSDKPDLEIALIQFDSPNLDLSITETFDFTPAPLTRRLTKNDYQPRGGTPLYSAIANGIARMEAVTRPQDRALIFVQTDGGNTENGEVTLDVLKALVADKKAEGNWTFAFAGADIDAYGAGAAMGVGQANSMSYANSRVGTRAAYQATSASTESWYSNAAPSVSAFYTDAQQADVKIVGMPDVKMGDIGLSVNGVPVPGVTVIDADMRSGGGVKIDWADLAKAGKKPKNTKRKP